MSAWPPVYYWTYPPLYVVALYSTSTVLLHKIRAPIYITSSLLYLLPIFLLQTPPLLNGLLCAYPQLPSALCSQNKEPSWDPPGHCPQRVNIRLTLSGCCLCQGMKVFICVRVWLWECAVMMDLSYMCLECSSACACVKESLWHFFFFNAYLCMGGMLLNGGMGASGLLHRVSQ